MTVELTRLAGDEIAWFVKCAADSMTRPGDVLALVEQAARSAADRIGHAMICQAAITHSGYLGASLPCDCGHQARFVGLRDKHITTMLGPVPLTRAYYHCGSCHKGLIPADQVFGVTHATRSAGVDKACVAAGSEIPFRRAAALIEEITGRPVVSPSSVDQSAHHAGAVARVRLDHETRAISQHRITPLPVTWNPKTTCYIMIDGTGAPMIGAETAGREGKTDDGVAHTREVKAGRFFTQTHFDQHGDPVMDPDSTSFITTFAPVDQFIHDVAAETLRRGFAQARRLVVVADGAKWIWRLAEQLTPDATHIVDYYHAKQHFNTLVDHLAAVVAHPDELRHHLKTLLYQGRIASLIATVHALDLPVTRPDLAEIINKDLAYFIGNHHRMNYNEFRRQHLIIGSGAIEAGCKVLVEQRTCLSGMRWTIPGADSIITLRALRRSPGRDHLIWEKDLSHTSLKIAA